MKFKQIYLLNNHKSKTKANNSKKYRTKPKNRKKKDKPLTKNIKKEKTKEKGWSRVSSQSLKMGIVKILKKINHIWKNLYYIN